MSGYEFWHHTRQLQTLTKPRKKETFGHRKAIFKKNVPYLKGVNLFLACERQFSAQL